MEPYGLEWKSAQKVFQQNLLGKFLRTEIIQITPGPEEPGRAISKCMAFCLDRFACCNILVKPKGTGTPWTCSLYAGKFGGLPDVEIEKRSSRSDDKWSFYKENKYCMLYHYENILAYMNKHIIIMSLKQDTLSFNLIHRLCKLRLFEWFRY